MASVRNDTLKYAITARSRQPGYRFCFLIGHHGWWSSYIILCGVVRLNSAQEDGSYHAVPIRTGTHEAATCCTRCYLWTWPHRKRKQLNSTPSFHMQRSTHKVSMSASQAILSGMQLTLHANHQTPHGASRSVRSNTCLVGEDPTRSVSVLQGCEGL